MIHHPVQRARVPCQAALVDPFRCLVPTPVPLFFRRTEEAAAQHRRERQRDESRDEDRDADRDGKLVEQPAHDPAHEQNGNEHGRQRQRHRHDGEADLARAVERGLHGPFSHLEMADDVLEHDDRVVHDESDRQRERHQGEVVEAVTHQVHHRKRADDGERQREARDHGRRQIPQEQEDHEDDQAQRDEQRQLHVVHRLPDRRRAVVEGTDFNRRGQLRREPRDRRLHRVRHLDGVCARLALDRQDDRAPAVEPAGRAVVLHVVQHARHVLEAHGRAVLIGHRELAKFGRARDRAVGQHRVRALRSPQRSRGKIGIAGRYGARDLVQSNPACRQRLRIHLNAHGVLLGTIDLHLCHATHGREALGEECFGVLVERRQRHRRRRQREIEDRRIGGVHLLVGRRLNARRQLAQCLGNRGLHVLRGRIDVARQRELQRDVGTAERAR